MKLNKLFITDEIGCVFHDGLNIILGVNRRSDDIMEEDHTGDGERVSEKPKIDSETTEERESTKGANSSTDSFSDDIAQVSDTNGVGKTLLVSVIKHVLGGDTETALSSSYFTENKYWGMLEVAQKENLFVFSRPLWRPLSDDLYFVFNGPLDECQAHLAKAKIKLEEVINPRELEDQLEAIKSPITLMSKKKFKKYIAKLENIDYSKSNITFSALLDFIIRDEKVGFNDPIARIRRAQWLQYRSAQYLFGLPATTEETCSKLLEEIAELRISLKAMRERLDSRGITGDDKIENLKLSAMAKLKKTREEIEEVKVIPSLEQARQEYQDTKDKYSSLLSDLNKKDHYLRGYMKNREDLRAKSKATTELLKVSEFYEDLIQFFPEQLEKNLSEFQTFFDDLFDDRERYYSELITEIRTDIKFLEAEKKHLEPRLASLAKQFKNTSIIRDISALVATEEKIQYEINELEECRKILLKCEAQEEKIAELESFRQNALKEGKKQEKKFQERRRSLINLFHELVSEIYGVDDGELAFEYNGNSSSSTAGRTEIICSIPSQSSHGRTYARINLFDFVWLLGEKDESDFRPSFLVHDGSYSKISREVKTKMLNAVLSRLAERQYFITINEGEFELSPDWEKYICCRLDGSKVEGKFFGQQFD